MTQLDQFLAFLKSAGYHEAPQGVTPETLADKEYLPSKGKYTCRGQYPHDEELVVEDAMTITLGSGPGYSGFYVEFIFDNNGKLIKHGCWE